MPKRGVLLVNLGSPDSTKVEDVKVYLREFLMDKNVIDAPYLIRKIIVELFILPRRPKLSAKAYQAIWWEDGSPLIVISKNLQNRIQENLDAPVTLAMRYGKPSIYSGLQWLIEQQSVNEIFLVPLYPHYAMATVETVVKKVQADLKKFPNRIQLSTVQPFYNEPAYIDALTASAGRGLNWNYDYLLFSYHGLPERHLKKTDPTRNHCMKTENCCASPSLAHTTCYRHQVFQTTAAFVKKMNIPENRYSIAFQSKIGVDKWLEPVAAREIERLAKSGVKKLAVICPAFVSDCIETLEEIGIRGREAFLAAGGEELRLIPCMNDHPVWIETLKNYCEVSESVDAGSQAVSEEVNSFYSFLAR